MPCTADLQAIQPLDNASYSIKLLFEAARLIKTHTKTKKKGTHTHMHTPTTNY